MEARETDVEYPQDDSIVASQLDGIAGGILDMIDNTSPLEGGTVESKEEVTEEVKEETQEATPEPEKEEAEEPDKFTIKWQGEEKEVTQDELIELAQKGFDYTKKTQDLAAERDNLAPYVGLANQIKARPELAQKIAELLTGTQQTPVSDDPVDQFKHELKQEATAIADKKIKEALDPIQKQVIINAVKTEVRRDPDFDKIQAEIVNLIKSQPPVLQDQLARRLNEDIPTYLDTFQFIKKKLATEAVKPTPVKKETKTPILEAGGVETPQMADNKAKTERISKMKAKALRSGDPSEIGKWLTESGALDHLY